VLGSGLGRPLNPLPCSHILGSGGKAREPGGVLGPGLGHPLNPLPCSSQWWRRQWVEEFFPPVSLGDPTLDMLLRQFGLQDKSPPRARSSGNTLAQALRWIRKQLSPLEASALLWGLLATVGAIRVMQALLGPQPPHSSPLAKEKHKPAPKKDSGAASKQPAPAPDNCSSSQSPRRKK